ncbi:hypothetical protein CVT26_002698 [Gymnopilus dilepis]|uniref:Las1-domain-containing protein n=1 Tax=Gymnopilus dilepis TaxID=231916 RepID=A0A409VCE5_9AGAR|nr:hypothetical protein CVT26_002698 [Gymnopilus dilepis]
MRLPRRVPWASLAELEEICAAIYADENDLDAKVFAINRISAWRTVTSLPHALESALALLVVLVHDKKQIYLTALQLRQSYATAILRLVNGLVDPLQVGTYARPITSIAQQLGLPGWLVELRHASTHEDLPSLDLLREATRQSLSWLLQNYFLPILNPVSNSLQSLPALRPLMPLLKLYKSTMKTVTKDLSLHSRYRPKIVAILRDIERWISEAKVSANIVAGDPDGSDVDFKEIWALERFCEGLIEKGMLVPLSKKCAVPRFLKQAVKLTDIYRKRQYSESELLPSRSSVASWSHLLDHLHGIHPDFFSVLSRQLTSTLMQADPDTEEAKLDPTYRAYIACWILWIVEASRNSPPASLEIKKQVLSSLVKGFNHGTMPQLSQSMYVFHDFDR